MCIESNFFNRLFDGDMDFCGPLEAESTAELQVEELNGIVYRLDTETCERCSSHCRYLCLRVRQDISVFGGHGANKCSARTDYKRFRDVDRGCGL